MHPRPSSRAWWQRPRTLVIFGGVALSAGMLALSVWTLYDDHEAARRQAEQQTSNLALTLEREVDRLIISLDLTLRAAVRGMNTLGLASMDPAIRQAILFDGATAASGYASQFITDQTGRVIYDSISAEPLPWSVADRGYFAAQQADRTLGMLISPPSLAHRTGMLIVPVTRRIDAPDGRFRGVAISGLQISYLESLFNSVAVGNQGIVALSSTDGTLIARRPADDGAIGRKFPGMHVFRALAQAPSGAFEGRSVMDGTPRIYSYRKVGSLPLVIAVGLSTQEVFADWAEKAAILSVALLVLLALGAGLAWALRRELQRRGEAETLARRSESEHAAALARLDVLFQNSLDTMFIVRAEPDGRFVYERVNPVWEQVSGVAAAMVVAHTPQECLAPGTASILIAAWSDCVRQGIAIRYAHTLKTPGGALDLEVLMAPVRDPAGRVNRLIGIGRNMTERNQLAATLLQAQRMEAVGQLTTGVAHDFNNLLQAIMVALELLQGQPGLDEEGRTSVSLAETAASRGASLVQQLLALSSKQALSPAVLETSAVVPAFAALLARTLGGRVQVETVVEPRVWPVFADRAQLETCLLNLALNARDAMPDGGTLRLHACNAGPDAAIASSLPPGEYTCIRIEDRGAGMPPETLARAFEPFFTTKLAGEGTGLGLSVVQGFARQSGGDLRIESQPGQGTTASLWLPRAIRLNPVAGPPEPQAAAIHGRGRILLVDDDGAVRQTLSIVLTKAGYSPLGAASGEAALSLLRAGEACDLLVTDQSMPGITGSELIGVVSVLRPALPVMLITGFDRASGLNQLEPHVMVLRKPFKREAFLGQVDAVLSAAQVAAATAV